MKGSSGRVTGASTTITWAGHARLTAAASDVAAAAVAPAARSGARASVSGPAATTGRSGAVRPRATTVGSHAPGSPSQNSTATALGPGVGTSGESTETGPFPNR